MDIDLSEQLKRQKIDLASKIDRSIGIASSDKAEKIKPFQADSRRWQRGGRFSTRVSSMIIQAIILVCDCLQVLNRSDTVKSSSSKGCALRSAML